MSLATARAVLFDLDGTLVDSAPDLAIAIDRLLVERGGAPVGEGMVRRWIGSGARRLVARALAGRRDMATEPAGTEAALARFLVLYGERLVVRSRLYPGVIEALGELAAAGVVMAVVTNKPEALTRALLDVLDLTRWFGAIVGGDTLTVRKPDPAPLAHAAELVGHVLADCVMVGDSITDVNAARNAQVPIVCVPYGYRDGDAIFDAQPDAVVDSLTELPALLEIEDRHHGIGHYIAY